MYLCAVIVAIREHETKHSEHSNLVDTNIHYIKREMFFGPIKSSIYIKH